MLVLHVQQHVLTTLVCVMLCVPAAELKCLQHVYELNKQHQKHWHGIVAWSIQARTCQDSPQIIYITDWSTTASNSQI